MYLLRFIKQLLNCFTDLNKVNLRFTSGKPDFLGSIWSDVMKRCRYCDYGELRHGEDCPATKEGQEKTTAMADYENGYKRGRNSDHLEAEEGKSPAYHYGYSNGLVALEEAENAFDPISEGRQW